MIEYLRRSGSRILSGLGYLWHTLAVGLPIFLAGISWMGYHYTALRLFTQVQQSLFLVVALIIAYALMQRWLFVARRTVAIENARRRREKAQAAPDTDGDNTIPPEEENLDLPAISAQSRQIFGAVIFVSVIIVFYSIWAPVLPALRMLDRV
ncbi:MAG: hypothetical protein IIC24_01225, partial [Chloroflexi bacterium]|nr:hypothetical protein [Chloroflexota bacterium]